MPKAPRKRKADTQAPVLDENGQPMPVAVKPPRKRKKGGEVTGLGAPNGA